MINQYLNKTLSTTEEENSLNNVSEYQEILRNDPEYIKWLDNLNCGEKPKPEKENDQCK